MSAAFLVVFVFWVCINTPLVFVAVFSKKKHRRKAALNVLRVINRR